MWNCEGKSHRIVNTDCSLSLTFLKKAFQIFWNIFASFFFVFCELKFGVKLIKKKFLRTFIFAKKTIASELNIETESLSVFFFL